ncbi:MAG: helix-turn-helix domain-containing protein [Thermomicrobiales bacterium]
MTEIVAFPKDTITLDELAARMGISRTVAYELARADRLPVPVIRVGRRFLFSRPAYQRLIEKQHTDQDDDVA